ncbi:MAG: hypothetical protein BWY52_01922 [Chloroflexi bacterium ADurb.Bin325]|nr:MAG: hypothetical protein BWY52_01922 [Chloroflexi bacterium ADurb.Bin325]
MHPEPGHHLVEDQQRAVGPGQLAQAGQEAGLRRHDAHVARHRLDDHRGDLPRVPGEQLRRGWQVVEGRDQRIRGHGRGHAGGIGQAQGRHAGAGAHQQHVGVAVVAALELDDLVPPGERARQPQRAHGGLRARVDEAQQLHAGHEALDQPGQLELQRAGRAEARTLRGRAAQRGGHTRVRMAEDQRPPREDVIQEAVAVHVVEIGPFPARDEQRVAAHRAERAHRRVHAAGEQGLGQGKQMLRAGGLHAPSPSRSQRAASAA